MVRAELFVSAHRVDVVDVAGLALVGFKGIVEEHDDGDGGDAFDAIAIIGTIGQIGGDAVLDNALVETRSDGESCDGVDPCLADLEGQLVVGLRGDHDGIRGQIDGGVHLNASGIVADLVDDDRWRLAEATGGFGRFGREEGRYIRREAGGAQEGRYLRR